jgi:hypothetical protein
MAHLELYPQVASAADMATESRRQLAILSLHPSRRAAAMDGTLTARADIFSEYRETLTQEQAIEILHLRAKAISVLQQGSADIA